MLVELKRSFLFFSMCAVVAWILEFAGVKFWWEIFLIMGLSFLLGRRSIYLLVAMSFGLLIFGDGLSNLRDGVITSFEWVLFSNYRDIPKTILGADIRFLSIIFCFSGLAGLLFVFRCFPRVSVLTKTLSVIFLFFLSLWIFEKIKVFDPSTASVLMPGLVLLSHLTLFLVIYHPQMTSLPVKEVFKKLPFFVSPFWEGNFFSYAPRERLDWREYQMEDVEQDWQCRLSGFVLVLKGLASYVLGHLLLRLVFGACRISFFNMNFPSLFLPSPKHLGLRAIAELPLPVWSLWLIALMNALLFLLIGVGAFGAFAFGIARLCGLSLNNNVNSPWKATSFAEFIQRILYYYTFFIAQGFYFPFYLKLKKIFKNRKAAQLLAVILAVCVGGTFYHSARDLELYMQWGFWGMLKARIYLMPYFIALALTIAFSKYYEMPSAWKNVYWKRAPFPLFYFTLYSLILLMHTNHAANLVSDRLYFFQRLFGIP